MALMDDLVELKRINDEDTESVNEYGAQKMGLSGEEIKRLLSVDGITCINTSPCVQEFYKFSCYWKHNSVELFWLDPKELGAIYKTNSIANMILGDYGPSGTFNEINVTRSNTALFAVDDLQSPFQRAYFWDNGIDIELKVIDAGSEVEVYDTVGEYVAYWRQVFEV